MTVFAITESDVEAVGKEVVKSVEKEAGQTIIEASLAGDNTYYQWGRKDPCCPAYGTKNTRLWRRVERHSVGRDCKDKR